MTFQLTARRVLLRRLVALFAAAVAFASSQSAAAAAGGAAPRPNVVFFLIDDLGYADCGFNGGTEIRTPNIDRLAKDGTVIDAHYVQPVCSPTRAALMTGRYATHTGVYTIVRPHAKWGLPLGERTLADALREAGYSTNIVGKWHLGEYETAYQPLQRGFDHHYGHYFGMLDYYTHLRGNDLDWYRDGKQLREEGYTTHLLTDEACRIVAAQEKTKPLFLYVPYNGVHSPMQVPDRYLEPYGKLSGARKQLAGMLAAVDEGVGRIVEALEKAGLRENTLILFSADNGGPPPGDNTPFRNYKGTIYEGGVRGAAFANWPGHVPAGARIKQPMHIIDWYPTLVKLAGGSLEQKLPLDGLDVWPMLTEGKPSPHDAILCVQSPQRAAVRMGDWKLLVDRGTTRAAASDEAASGGAKQPKGKKRKADAGPTAAVELYNLADDVGEKNNLAEQEPARVATLRARLDELLKNAVPSGAVGETE